MIINITQLSQLQAFAETFAHTLKAGEVIYLKGELGAGKTTLVQMLLAQLRYSGRVKSPTYGLYETYDVGDFRYIHMDLYRIGDPQELYYLGLDEIFDGVNIVLIEWPEKGQGVIPIANKTLSLAMVNAKNRRLKLEIT